MVGYTVGVTVGLFKEGLVGTAVVGDTLGTAVIGDCVGSLICIFTSPPVDVQTANVFVQSILALSHEIHPLQHSILHSEFGFVMPEQCITERSNDSPIEDDATQERISPKQ